MTTLAPPASSRGRAIAIWGVGGVVLLFCRAIVRLGAYAIEPLRDGSLGTGHIALYIVWVAFSAYGEGYKAFQLRFCPRVVARAAWLASHPSALRVALAPAFCMGFFHANRKTLALAWGTTIMVIGFIVALHHTPQPWRGIIDGGVVVALAWGAVALVVLLARAMLAGTDASAELP